MNWALQIPVRLGFRTSVLDDVTGKPLATMLRTLERAGYRAGAYETLRKAPRGVDPDHPRADILKRKGLIVSSFELPRELLTSRRLIGWLATHAKRTAPLVEWLAERID
jgi:uncharacterized protein (DUF2461 family)